MTRHVLRISLNDSAKAFKPYHGRLVVHYLLILISPLLVFFGVGFAIPLIVLLDFISLLFVSKQKHQKALLFLVATSPFIAVPLISIACAGLGYMLGNASPHTVCIIGADQLLLPVIENLNIDPVTRRPVVNSMSLLVAVPLGYLTVVPYNLTLGRLSRVLGPMRGTYRGEYPTHEAACDFLDTEGKYWTRHDLKLAKNLANDTSPSLTGKELLIALDTMPERYSDIWRVGRGGLLLAKYSPDCLVVHYATVDQIGVIALVDLHRRVPFAWYVEPSAQRDNCPLHTPSITSHHAHATH